MSYSFLINFRRLWAVALPLMLSSLSGVLMVFVDRLTLACYGLEAHNAVVEATNISWAFLIGFSVLCNVTQVFTSQYEGAGNYKAMGRAVWQMVWLSLFSVGVFWWLSLWMPELFFGTDSAKDIQRTYFSWMILFTPAHGFFAAFCGFYIGRKKTLLPTALVLGGNIINGVLCYTLVFGVEGIIPSMGAYGAAIATNAAVTFQIVIFFFSFLQSSLREKYGTDQWKPNIDLFKKCLRVGLPNAFFIVLEITGWAFFYKMMSGLGKNHLTVAGIVQNILILTFFFNEGMSKAVSALVGNSIGAKRFEEVSQIVKTGFISMVFFGISMALFLWISHETILSLFLQSLTIEQKTLLYSALLFGCANAIIYKFLEGIRMVVAGALIAAADSLFLMVAGSSCVWVGMVLPIYYFVYLPGGSIESALILCSFYTLVAALLYIGRFYSNAWKNTAQLVTN